MLFSLDNLYRHYLQCRRNKRNTLNALRFEARQEEHLLALRDALVDHAYAPARSVCFVVQRPKLREIFAADFRDRIVHHVLVDELERTWEPIFIQTPTPAALARASTPASIDCNSSSVRSPATAPAAPGTCNSTSTTTS